MTDSLERMIQSYASRLVEQLRDTKQIADRTGDLYQRGRECGFYMALTMLAIRAKSFGVDLRMIGLEDINAEELV